MGIDRHCRWVRHRLPLLVGGELGVDERRKVERHLIGCPDCKCHREASTGALSALRAFAEVTPAVGDAPSLWPALSDQIRLSKHAAPSLSWWETPLPRAWAALSLAMGLIGVVATPLSLLSGREPERPAPVSIEAEFEPATVEFPKLASTPSSALPSGRPTSTTGSKNLDFDPTATASIQLNYDLDHGTPMGPGNRDPQHSY